MGRWKKYKRNLQEKSVSEPQDTKCTPGESKSQFSGHLKKRRVYETPGYENVRVRNVWQPSSIALPC